MMKKSFARFAAWATRSRSSPLALARWKQAGLFFLVGTLIFLVVGSVIDAVTDQSIRDVLLWETGEPVEEALRLVQTQVWIGRAILFVLFAIAAYALAEFAIQPMRRSMERQRRFIANVSHELRTPLAVMRTALDVALRKGDRLSPEDVARVLRNSRSEVERLSNIITFLLAFADLENRHTSLAVEEVDLAAPAERGVAFIRAQAEEKGVILECEVSERVLVRGNATALEELVINLLKNALNHTGPGGTIAVRVGRAGDGYARIAIADTGSGIAQKDIKRIFEPYYRGGNDTGSGMGLGLSIAQEIAHLHGATIAVSSAEGRGSAFTVEFPERLN